MTLYWRFTRGYGLAVAVLLLSMSQAGDAWLPRFSKKTQTVSLSSSNSNSNDNEEIAKAWRQVDADMTRNDQEALDVWKELRANFQKLAASPPATDEETLVAQLAAQEAQALAEKQSRINQAKLDSEGVLMQAKWDQQQAHPVPQESLKQEEPAFLQAHDLQDEEAAKLVAQLAALEAKELAEKESRIAKARQDSEGILMQAKLDLQQAFPAQPKQVPFVEIPQAHDLVDNEAANLVAELAALDAQERNFKETLIEHAYEVSEGTLMAAKLDQQQAHPVPPPQDTSFQDQIPQAHDLMDPAAAKLVQELAALDAQERNFKETLIDHAHQVSEGITMNAKLDQQLLLSTLGKEQEEQEQELVVNAVDPEAEAALLVAQLAAKDAAELAAKESLINSARGVSEGAAMTAKIELQEQVPATAKTKPNHPTIPQAHDVVDADAKKLVAELAALDAAELTFKESLIGAARVTSELQIMDAKIEEQGQHVRPPTSKARPPPQFDEDVAQLVAHLAAKDASEFNAKESRVNKARDASNIVTMQAKIDQQQLMTAEPATIMEPEIQQAHDLVDQEASHLVAQLAAKDAAEFSIKQSRINSARDMSEGVAMEAKYKQQEKQAMNQEQEWKIEQAKQLRQQLTMLEAKQFAIQLDMARSNAVKEDAKVEPPPAPMSKNNKKDPNEKRLKQELNALEAAQLALQVDMAKSNAVKEDVKMDSLRQAAAQVIEPVVLAAEKITKALAQEETVVEAEAEPVFLKGQNPNQVLQVIDVEALQSAAQEVQDASEMLSAHLPDSEDKESIIQVALEAAESVLQEVQEQQNSFMQQNPKGTAMKRPKSLMDPTGPSLADLNNNGMTAKKVQEMKNVQRVTKPQMLEPLPQDVTNHQEDAARFFFAKRAAQEISMKEDPYYLKKRTAKTKPARKEITAAELAAMEHDEVDQQLRELFADVSLGFKEVKQSLARLLRSEKSADDLDGMSNSTAWEGMTP